MEVSELTRGGTVVRTARFMTSRVIALVEHPVTAARGAARVRREHPGEPGEPGEPGDSRGASAGAIS
jgi:hypothetical protein